MKGKWRIAKMPGYEADFLDMMEPAYIQFEGDGGGEFAFGCVTGAITGAGDTDVEFSWAETTRWTRLAATDGPNFSPTPPSKVKSASMAAMKPTSAPSLEDFFNSLLELNPTTSQAPPRSAATRPSRSLRGGTLQAGRGYCGRRSVVTSRTWLKL